LRQNEIGAVLVEPIQTRGGINLPARGFLPTLRRLCDRTETVLILDEIYTGFARTGRWFACEHWDVAPDLICLGKALTGGFPLAACVGRSDLMDRAWPVSSGEAIHTSTFLGHPVGCAMALAQIEEIRRRHLPERASRLGRKLLQLLDAVPPPPGLELQARGLGLLVGLEIRKDGKPATAIVLRLIREMLRKGFLVLPEGEHANVISFTPPLIMREEQLCRAVSVLKTLLELSQSRTSGADQP
jgi:4-aminobutyrate aminotransferase-like enzyme